MSQKRIEDIFKDALEHDQAPAHDGDWAQMAKMLDGPPTGKNEPERRRRKWLFWWWLPFIFTGVALFTVFYKPNEKNTGNPVAKQEQPATNTKNPQQPETASNNTNTATGKNNDTQMVPPHTGIIKEQNTVQPVQPSGPLQPNSGAISPENNRGSIGRAEQENNDSPVNARKQGTAGITGIPDLGNKKANTTNNRFPRRNKTIKEQQAAPANDEPVNRYYGKQKRVRPSARYAKSKINGETLRNKKNRFNENSAAELYDEVESEAPAIESKLQTVGQLKKMNLAMPELPGLTTPYLVAGKALPDTFIRNEKVSRYKQKPFRERSKNMLGLPQWVSVGYDVLPLASSRYNMRYFSTPFTPYQEPEFYLDSMNPRKVSRGGHIAIGGEWFPRNDQWSLNSYLALQYSEASQLSRSSKINYGVGYAQVDTVTFLKYVGAIRLGTDWVKHARNKKWQAGIGVNMSYILISRGDIYDFSLYTTSGGSAGGQGVRGSYGLFRGINRFNLGFSGVAGYRLFHPVWLELRAGFDLLDMTRKSYYNYLRHNLSYYSIGLKFSLQKKDNQ